MGYAGCWYVEEDGGLLFSVRLRGANGYVGWWKSETFEQTSHLYEERSRYRLRAVIFLKLFL